MQYVSPFQRISPRQQIGAVQMFRRAQNVRAGIGLGRLGDSSVTFSDAEGAKITGSPNYVMASGGSSTPAWSSYVPSNNYVMAPSADGSIPSLPSSASPSFNLDPTIVNTVASAAGNFFKALFGTGSASSQMAPPPPVVQPPFYQQTWFMVVAGVAAVGAVGYVISKA